MKYKSIRGMEDILPDRISIWQKLEETAREELRLYGYKEIRTPILEDTSIFVRSIGETTDIVKKEMYTFKDRKGRSLTLRPEATAPIVRAYIERSLYKTSPELKLYYIGPMFRSERPQKGRSRQFHQIGVEYLGTRSPYADAEVITQLSKMLGLFGLEGFTIKLNSLGCDTDKKKYADGLRKYLKDKQNRLCQDCKERIKSNVLRVLDCKKESCIQVVRQAPNILDGLCDPCRDHFDKLKAVLSSMKIAFVETKNLVRGLDYYTGTVFEITHPALGGQDAIGAGGRYDNLVKDFGGPDTGAIGYAIGMERILIALGEKAGELAPENVIYIATLGEKAKIEGLRIAEHIRIGLRQARLLRASVILNEEKDSLKAQMRSADRNKASFTIILGEDELKERRLTLRDMETRKQDAVDEGSIVSELIRRLSK